MKKKKTTYDLLEALDWLVVLKVTGVVDLSWGPLSFVFGVVNHRGIPLAPVGRVWLHRPLPLAAPRSISALGVWNSRSNPITVLLIIPFLGLHRVWIRDGLGFIIEPTLGLDGILVNNLVGSIIIPVVRLSGRLGHIDSSENAVGAYLSGIRIGDPLGINPVLRLLVLGVVDLLGWVDGWIKVGEEATGRRFAIVDGDGVGIIWTKYGCQDGGGINTTRTRNAYLMTSVYNFVAFSMVGTGALVRCFSSYSPVMGFLWRKIK